MEERVLSREQVRRVDRLAIEHFHLPGIALMENAGRGTADLLQEMGVRGTVVICAGAGNNGGDGFVVARHLEARGYDVLVFLWTPPQRLRGDALVNLRVLQAAKTPLVLVDEIEPALAELEQSLSSADWAVDALLGTGARGDPRSPYDMVIERLNAADVRRLAIDIPSGLDCDTGETGTPTFRADITATFVAKKPGLVVESAHPWVGRLEVLDIGVPRRLWNAFDDDHRR